MGTKRGTQARYFFDRINKIYRICLPRYSKIMVRYKCALILELRTSIAALKNPSNPVNPV
jgi:hypothetical protein